MALFGFFSVAGFTFYAIRVILADLPEDLQAMREPPSKATLVFAADGELIGEFYLQKRVVIPHDRMPEHVRQAFVAAEDGRFWEHPGFDLMGIARAASANFRGSGSKQGASTITQQLTRMLMLTNERTYYRKMKELVLSVRVERELSKRDILEMYLNRVYLGHGAYGVQAAAEVYYGKDAANLTLAEAAMLAGLVQRPAAYDPRKNLQLARGRQRYVLSRMQVDDYITMSSRLEAVDEPITLVDGDVPLNFLAAPYFVEHVRQWAERRLGANAVYSEGLRIYTTLDTKMQQSAEAAVRNGLESVDRRIGFRGAIDHLDEAGLQRFRANPPKPYLPGLQSASLSENAQILDKVPYLGAVVDLPRRGGVLVALGANTLPMEDAVARHLRSWRGTVEEQDEELEAIVEEAAQTLAVHARPPKRPKPRRPERVELRVGDVLPVTLAVDDKGNDVLVLAQVPDVQGAMVVMDPHAGAVRALVGGYDFQHNKFNRATQAKRQIGSAFKPVIYAAAMANGVTHVDLVKDAPVAVRTAGGIWSPKNYDGKYLGTITLRTALAKSLNTVSVRLVLSLGVDAVIDMARKLGIVSPIPRHISIALGTPDLTLIEIVSAYSAFANGGKRVQAQDDHPGSLPGRFVELVTTSTGEVVRDFRDRTPTEQVIPESLAYLTVDLMKAVVERGTAKQALELGRPAAGKTGTSTNWKVAWFIGYTPDLVAGVWVARDDDTPIGAKSTGGTAALPIWLQFMQAAHPATPLRDFPVPTDVTLVRANELTGQPASGHDARLVPFARGTLPSKFAPDIRKERFDTTDDFSRFE